MQTHISSISRLKELLLSLMVLLLTAGTAEAQSLQEKIAARQQLTNLPTIYLTVPDAEGQDINSVLKKENGVAEYHAATIEVVDASNSLENFTDDKLEIKVRGNSTAGDSKKPYRLKFAKDKKDAEGNVIETHKHDMLGLGYKKRNWTLLTNHKDKSLLHNALTYHVGKAVGMDFCPGYKFVDLVINGEYRGNYQISDHCEVGSHRVDVDEETGWFIEAARGDMVEEPLVEAAGLRMSIKNPEPATEEETAKLKADVSAYFQKLNHFWGIYSTPCSMEEFVSASGWTSVIDEESLAKFYVGINLTDDYDGFMTVKMYREADGKLKFGPLWDKDLAYGNWQNHGKLAEEYQPGYTFCDHMARMMTDPYFVKKVHDKLHEVVDAGFVTNMQAQIYAMGAEISESQALNQSIWWTCDNYPAAQEEFADYIEEHTAFFVNAIDEKYETMGCAELGERPRLAGGAGEGEGAGGNDGHTCPYVTTIEEWQNVPLPSSAIHPRATAAHLKVVGTSFFLLMNSNSESDKIDQYSFSWDGANMSGREFDITDEETLGKMKAGSLYIRCGGGRATVTITCTVPEGDDDSDPEIPAERAQLTNLPTIYLDAEVGNEWSGASLEVFDSENKFGQGTTWTKATTDVSVQYQGSGDKNKDSYRLKFESKTQLLSSGKYKQWVLASNDDDPSLMRNALAKTLGDALGLPFTPGYQFVDLFVNDTYMGTYQVTDRIKAESGRALVANGNKDNDWQIRLNDASEIAEDKKSGLTDDDYIAGTTSVPYIIPRNPDKKEISAEAWSQLKADMSTYFNAVFAQTGGHYTALEDNVDKQQLIQWYIAQEVLGVYKGFSSIEAYRSVTAADKNLHLGILWDNEKSLGNPGEAPAIDMSDLETADSYKGLMTRYAAYDVMKALFTDLWTQPWFANGVRNLWEEKHEALIAALNSQATAMAETLSESQARNLEKWSSSLEGYSSYEEAVSVIGSYLTARDAYLTAKFSALAAALPCTEHTYLQEEYAKQDDNTYRRACDNCGAAEEGDDAPVYYLFKIYEEAKTPSLQYTTDREWFKQYEKKDQKPNTLFVTEAAGIHGTNVVSAGYCDELVITDGHPFYYKETTNFYAAKASYTRSISQQSHWGTVCLPFKTEDNDDVRLYALSEVDTDSQDGTMTFASAQKTGALTPLVFRKRVESATSVTFTGAAQENGYVTVKPTQGMSENYSKEIAEGWNMFGNVYEPKEKTFANDPNMYYIAGDLFYHATGTLTVNPFRAYFSGPADTPAAARFSIRIEDDEEGIEPITTEAGSDVIFDISGRRIDAITHRGIYIVNGRKVISK